MRPLTLLYSRPQWPRLLGLFVNIKFTTMKTLTTIANHFNAGALTVAVKSALTTLTITRQGVFYQVWVNEATVQLVEPEDLPGYFDLLQGEVSINATYPE